jgi:Putative Flp pilus-assembly TadE/G-like
LLASIPIEAVRSRNLGEKGQTTILVVGLAMVVFAVCGLAVDGTRAFLFRRTLQNIADSSVMAAAGEINQSRYYASGGRDLQLDPAVADRTAREWLARRGLALAVSVQTNEREVMVTASGMLQPTFLGMIGIHRIPVEVQAEARPAEGALPP